tara:strand:+ start:3815 stop:6457 length:2643 start_codon:yes stop_codon:yes gene_type:complete
MFKNTLTILLLSFVVINLQAQYTSIHHEQNDYYKQFGELNETQFDELFRTAENLNTQKKACNLNYAVYGWHPYWVGTAYNNYDFNLLSTFSYFSYELVPSTGNYSSIYSWKTTPSIDMAQAAGCKVELCVTNFGSSNNATFLTNATAQQTFIDSLIVLLNYRNATGVNIDFEGVSGSNRNDLTNFMIMLSNQLKTAIPNATVTMATYSVDWNNVFDFAVLNNYVDQFIIMGYGYYYSGSSTAGPTDPLYSGTIWSSYNLIRSILYHLDEGVSKEKLLIGLPYYGYEFETTSNTVPSSTTGNFSSSRTYKYVENNTSGNYSTRLYDSESETPYYIYQTGGNWRQAYVMDEESLAERLDWIKGLEIGGMGIWALGYDDGYTELWDVIEQKFTDCAPQICSDTIYDTGGAFGKYRLNEDYTYLISSNGTTPISINFSMFDVEPGNAGNCEYDYLEIFDGADTTASLIGKYCNDTGSPGTIVGSGSNLTLRFHSDGATQNNGWVIATSCIIDTIKPTTQISLPPNSATDDFTSNFTDADNIGGSGIKHQFYQVADSNGIEWRSNIINGFFNDEFNNGAIHTDWIDSSGIWNILGGYVAQTDEANANTNIYVSCNQNGSNKYLYQYQMQISGVGANKRAGFHYMSDDASLPNRGNSYFVWFRQDNSKLQFYKVVNDVFSLEKEVPLVFNANQWYDIKIVYDKTNGETEVWMDDGFVSSWTDSSPITLGNYISLRSGNCIYDVDNVSVYKTRTNSPLITVGNDPSDDIRYAGTPAGRIYSIIIDSALNVSSLATEFVNVDLTTSLNELNSNDFVVYPNPTSQSVTVEFNDNQKRDVRIVNIAGQTIINQKITTKKTTLNVAELATGVYFLEVKNNDELKTIKLIKQ